MADETAYRIEKRLVDLYSRLLTCLPQGFRDEFAQEMAQVFAGRMREAALCGRRAVLCVFIDDLLALPGL